LFSRKGKCLSVVLIAKSRRGNRDLRNRIYAGREAWLGVEEMDLRQR
jgi:hypothetical protein